MILSTKDLSHWTIPSSIVLELPSSLDKRQAALHKIKEDEQKILSNWEPNEDALNIYESLLKAKETEISIQIFDYINNEVEFEPIPTFVGELQKVYLQRDSKYNIQFTQCYIEMSIVEIDPSRAYYLNTYMEKIEAGYKGNLKNIHEIKFNKLDN